MDPEEQADQKAREVQAYVSELLEERMERQAGLLASLRQILFQRPVSDHEHWLNIVPEIIMENMPECKKDLIILLHKPRN